MQLFPSEAESAPHIVLVHGLGSSATAWKPLIPVLLPRFNVITVDLPGHGKTPFDKSHPMDPHSLSKLVVREVALQFDVTNFDLVGNSWGGWIALEMAADHPESVNSVVALAPAGFWLASFVQSFPGEKVVRLFSKSTAAIAPTFLKYEWARKYGFESVSPCWREFTEELCRDATIAMANSPGYVPGSNGMIKKRFDSTIDPDIPVTIIFGDSDNTLPASICQERTMAPAHSQWKVFTQSGHAPMWDHPEQVGAEIFAAAGIRR